jgi:hypothetical protein
MYSLGTKVNLATNYLYNMKTISPKVLGEVAWLLLNGNLLCTGILGRIFWEEKSILGIE